MAIRKTKSSHEYEHTYTLGEYSFPLGVDSVLVCVTDHGKMGNHEVLTLTVTSEIKSRKERVRLIVTSLVGRRMLDELRSIFKDAD